MNNYQQLQKNLHELKLTQISLQIDDYINKINEHKLSIVDALCELMEYTEFDRHIENTYNKN